MGILDAVGGGGRESINSVSAFQFKELIGARRILTLNGRALPYRPFRETTKQRNDRTTLPGYSRATLSLFGAEEVPTEINGYWKDRFISSSKLSAEGGNVISQAFDAVDNAIGAAGASLGLGSPPFSGNSTVPITFAGRRVETVREAAQIITDWVRGGVLLEVTWDNKAWHGIIEEFEKSWHNAHDLEWVMKFSWVGVAEPTIPAVVAEELSVSDTASLFQALADALGTEALPPTFPLANDVFRDIDQGIKRIADTTARVAATVESVANLVLAPANAVRQVIALSDTLAGQCDSLIFTLRAMFVPGGQWHTQSTYNPTSAQQTSVRPATTLAISQRSFTERAIANEYVRRVSSIARQLMVAAFERKTEYQLTLNRVLDGTYDAREGDDLRNVSKTFYDTPHEWRRIMIFNGLTSPVLAAGQTVLIPKRSIGEGC